MFELTFEHAFAVLGQQSTLGLILMFWYVVILELPRYGLSILALVLVPRAHSGSATPKHLSHEDIARIAPSVSVVVAGLNEAGSLERCVRSLREQSYTNFEIVIVSDGSTDRMPQLARELVRRGLADKAFSTDTRCGKSSGLNLGIRYASGDIVVNVDCDCSYDRYAIQRILETFADPTVGGSCGDIIPRNGKVSLVASLQVIEYLMSISLGKRVAAMFDQVVCASGAFSAWRMSSLKSVGALDPGGGEDLDLTIRLRTMGWKIRFASEAICYTDVPATDWNFIRQRLRWERDAVRVRFRKHRRLFLPTSSHFPASEVLHQVDFFVFNVLLTVTFPFYLMVLFVQMGTAIFFILIAAQIGLMLLDAIVFLTAVVTTRRWHLLSYLAYIPAYTLYSTISMRNVRLFAYVQEWFFDSSRQDTYVPRTVLKARKW